MCNVSACLVGDVWRVLAVSSLALGEPRQTILRYTTLQRGHPSQFRVTQVAPRALVDKTRQVHIYLFPGGSPWVSSTHAAAEVDDPLFPYSLLAEIECMFYFNVPGRPMMDR